ncbi:hypothetical protein [Arthrobacter sp. 754]|uniref:hypothetical protein n=1 Tax=Arthrobacter sp. 754 TaxID=3156315 RepID=UPI0033930EAE
METAGIEVDGATAGILAAEIPVLAGQASIEELLPGVPGVPAPWASPVASAVDPVVAEDSQPALF